MKIILESAVKKAFPELLVEPVLLTDLAVTGELKDLEDFKKEVIEEIREDYSAEKLKDAPIIRMYRNFFWRAGIDPTKIRPASEALIRRVLKGRELPKINTLVDSYNLASMKTNMALAAFDAKTVSGELLMRFSNPGEEFRGIGMDKPIVLKGKEPIIQDENQIIAVYPYRDSDDTKVTVATKDALVLVCGVPGITKTMMDKAKVVTIDYIKRFCEGKEAD
jgi:DNA/RNA-binding domain of Phe-tRNA-synthetase-like protein